MLKPHSCAHGLPLHALRECEYTKIVSHDLVILFAFLVVNVHFKRMTRDDFLLEVSTNVMICNA